MLFLNTLTKTNLSVYLIPNYVIMKKSIIALLELVHFLYHGDGDDEIVILELAYCIVVVEDHIGVQHKDLRFAHMRLSVFAFGVLHQCFQYVLDPGLRGCVDPDLRGSGDGMSQREERHILKKKLGVQVVEVYVADLNDSAGDFGEQDADNVVLLI